MVAKPTNQEEHDQIYRSLGAVARIGTSLPVPIAPERPQPFSQDEMRDTIAANGYEIVQTASPPYTHVIAVDFHHVEPTPLVYYLAEVREQTL